MDIKQINSAIMFGTFSDTELCSVIDSIKFARANLVRQNKYTLRPGTRVKFHSTRRGITVEGTVTKIAVKYATVNTDQGLWKVPMNMLKAA